MENEKPAAARALRIWRTASEDDYYRQFARQLGDIGAISTMILGSVFFSIVLLTGTVTSQALRERIPELATLKTLGFSDGAVSALVLAEPVLLCLAGASAGGIDGGKA